MSFVPRQLLQRRERRLEPLDGFCRAGPAEIPRGGRGEQIEADIGRRGPVCDNGMRILLEIVRGQHVVGRRHEGLEVAPSAPGDQPEHLRVRRLQRRHDVRGPAGPQGERRRAEPQHRERQRQRPRARSNGEAPCGDAQQSTPSHTPIETLQVQMRTRHRLCCGRPFEQVAFGHEDTPKRPCDGVSHAPGLVGHEDDREQDLCGRKEQVHLQHLEPVAEMDIGTAGGHREQGRHEGGHDYDGEDQQHADEASPQRHQPAQAESEQGRGRQQRPPQVVQHLPSPKCREPAPAGPEPEHPW